MFATGGAGFGPAVPLTHKINFVYPVILQLYAIQLR